MSFWIPSSEEGTHSPRRPLYLFLLASLGVGAIASIFTEPNLGSWYVVLKRPVFAPGPGLFAPIWTGLYIMMAIAAWRVWKITGLWLGPRTPGARQVSTPARGGGATLNTEMSLFAAQLMLQLVWSLTVFGYHDLGLGTLASLVLDLTLIATILLFWRREPVAGLLLLPCLIWACFMSLLTYDLWQLNT